MCKRGPIIRGPRLIFQITLSFATSITLPAGDESGTVPHRAAAPLHPQGIALRD